MEPGYADGAPVSDRGGWAARLGVLCWALMMLGCLALVRAPWLPWLSSWDGSITISINGFNGEADDSIFPGQAATAQTDTQSDGTVPDLPSLSAMPPYSGGNDINARSGVLVLVPAATALFIALWTAWGEIERRRSMARIVFVLGALTLIPLLRDLVSIAHAPSVIGPTTVGIGIDIGLGGATAAMLGAGLLYWMLGRQSRE